MYIYILSFFLYFVVLSLVSRVAEFLVVFTNVSAVLRSCLVWDFFYDLEYACIIDVCITGLYVE
jgi:hypothetical protein